METTGGLFQNNNKGCGMVGAGVQGEKIDMQSTPPPRDMRADGEGGYHKQTNCSFL